MSAVATNRPASRDRLIFRVLYTPLFDLARGRVRPKMDIQRLIADADLPEPLARLTLEVVRRTRLCVFERVDVAAELIDHFQEGLDAGASSTDLVDRFGNPRDAARLIRRAKKRTRPFVWRALDTFGRGVLLLITLCILLYVVQAIRLHTASQVLQHNYLREWNALALAIPEAERAWPLYHAASIAAPKWPTHRGSDPHPGSIHWPKLTAFVTEHTDILDQYRAATTVASLGAILTSTQPTGEPEENPVFLTVLLPQATVLREAGQYFVVDTYLAAQAGDADRAASNLTALLRAAEHAYEIRLLISDLIGLRLINQACVVLDDLLADHPDVLSDSQLVDLSHRLATVNGGGDLRVRFDSEHAVVNDLLQRLYSDDGHGDGLPRPDMLSTVAGSGSIAPFPGGRWSSYLMPVLSPAMATRREVADKFDRLLSRCELESRQTLWQRQPSVAERELDALKSTRFEQFRYLPISIFMPSLVNASLSAEYVTQRRDATLVAVALQLHHRRHDAWPATLDDLVPHLLPHVPPDRYDGQAIKYRIVDGQPLLYSIGVDRDDDSGRAVDLSTLRPVRRTSSTRAARTWLPPKDEKTAHLRTAPRYPDGDWVLWPIVRD